MNAPNAAKLYRIQKSLTFDSASWVDNSSEITANAISTTAISNYTTPTPTRELWRVVEAWDGS
jgi:hypothetical protein